MYIYYKLNILIYKEHLIYNPKNGKENIKK